MEGMFYSKKNCVHKCTKGRYGILEKWEAAGFAGTHTEGKKRGMQQSKHRFTDALFYSAYNDNS